MAITVCGSCISFGSFDLCSESTGFNLGGAIKAKDGFVQAIHQGQGSTCGFVAAGRIAPPPGATKVIDAFPLANITNGSNVGELSSFGDSGRGRKATPHSDTTHGYMSGGYGDPSPGANQDEIHRFPFASPNSSSDVGDLITAGSIASGTSSQTHGYVSGGQPARDTIEKFPFASSGNASDVGEMTQTHQGAVGITSFDFGYTAGNYLGGSHFNRIERFPFSSDNDSSDVGDLPCNVCGPAGVNSKTHGYAAGGRQNNPGLGCNFIQKFPFASSTNATDIGNLSQQRHDPSGVSSETEGVVAGGCQPGIIAAIETFPFATDTDAQSVGSLNTARHHATGHQF